MAKWRFPNRFHCLDDTHGRYGARRRTTFKHRTWIFPRYPEFATKAGRILDLYARHWQGKRLKSDEFVISADEKTSIQARIRKHPSLPPRPAQPGGHVGQRAYGRWAQRLGRRRRLPRHAG